VVNGGSRAAPRYSVRASCAATPPCREPLLGAGACSGHGSCEATKARPPPRPAKEAGVRHGRILRCMAAFSAAHSLATACFCRASAPLPPPPAMRAWGLHTWAWHLLAWGAGYTHIGPCAQGPCTCFCAGLGDVRTSGRLNQPLDSTPAARSRHERPRRTCTVTGAGDRSHALQSPSPCMPLASAAAAPRPRGPRRDARALH
jgi:hypothetical protein